MSAVVHPAPRTTQRLAALARAEFTLLVRSKGTLFAALVVPLALPLSVRSTVDGMDLADHGLTPAAVVLPSALGFSLLFAVYSALTGILVARREELVLKRLRTGELRDAEILLGAALPAMAIAVGQCLLLGGAFATLLAMGAPRAPYLTVLGLLLGLAIGVALAALTAAVSRTTESAAVAATPLLLVSMLGSGISVPLEVMPDQLADVCRVLPLTGVMTLVRGGFTGALDATAVLGALASAVAWAALAVFAVRRWFRWEPRR